MCLFGRSGGLDGWLAKLLSNCWATSAERRRASTCDGKTTDPARLFSLGHVVFYLDCGDGALFSGDVLFQGGVGRFFEGNPTQVYTPTYLLP